MSERSEWRDGLWMSAAFWALLILSLLGTPLSFISLSLLPLPFLVYTAKHTARSGAIFAAVHVLFTVFIHLFWMFVTFVAAGTGWLMGQFHHRHRQSIHRLLLAGTLAILAGILGMIGLLSTAFDVPLADVLKQQWENSIDVYKTLWATAGIQLNKAELEQMRRMTVSLLPAVFLMWAGSTALLNHAVGRLILRRMGVPTAKLPPFRRWQFPRSFLLWYVVSMIVLMASTPGTFWHSAAVTASWLLQLTFVVQALSLLVSFLYRIEGLSRPTFIVLTVLFSPLLLMAVTLLYLPLSLIGMFDVGFRLRDKLGHQR